MKLWLGDNQKRWDDINLGRKERKELRIQDAGRETRTQGRIIICVWAGVGNLSLVWTEWRMWIWNGHCYMVCSSPYQGCLSHSSTCLAPLEGEEGLSPTTRNKGSWLELLSPVAFLPFASVPPACVSSGSFLGGDMPSLSSLHKFPVNS